MDMCFMNVIALSIDLTLSDMGFWIVILKNQQNLEKCLLSGDEFYLDDFKNILSNLE